jgi:hypothetical protein
MGTGVNDSSAMKPTNASDPALNGSLSYPDFLPLLWRPQVLPQNPAELHALCAGNPQVLAAVTSVESHGGPADEESQIDREIARLHRKVDLLVDLIGSLLSVHAPRPSAVHVELSAQDLHWSGPDAPPPGEGIIEIYLHRSVAHPLRLPARSMGDGRIVFLPLDETTAAALETHVFLRHRRSVAEARLSQKR